MTWQRSEKILVLLFLVFFFGLTSSQVHDFDLFWQLQSGKHIWQSGSFIYHDLFTLAAEVPRWEHCWLHDLIVYGVYSVGGYAGISLWKGLLLTATAGVLTLVARRRGAPWTLILLCAPLLLLLTRLGWAERPQLWSYLLFALFLLLLEGYRQTPTRLLWALVPLTALWANLHAGSILAFPVVGAYVAGTGVELWSRRSTVLSGRDWRRMLLVFVALVPTSLLTPYGLMTLQALWVAPTLGVDSGQLTQINNMDWFPNSFTLFPAFYYLMAGASVACALAWRRVAASDLFLLGGLAFMGIKLVRHTPFFLFACLALLPALIYAIYQAWTGDWSRVRRRAVIAGAVVLGLSPLFTLAAAELKVHGWFDRGLRTWHFPVAAAEFVRTEKLPQNLWNTYDWGGYLMWTLYPEYRVFWDSRQNSREMFAVGLTVMRGEPGWAEILDRFQVQTVVTKGCTVVTGQRYPLIDRLRVEPGWALVFADESALVFVRRNAVPADWLQRHELPVSRVDDTILSEATLLAQTDPGRYMAWWEMARILMARNDYRGAFPLLERHLATAPAGQSVSEAEKIYRILYPLMQTPK